MTKPKDGRYHWLKWWPSRWFADRRLRTCSLAARGAWHEILLTIHEENTGGYLLIGGVVPDADDIALLLACTAKEWRACEAELERRKVFSRRESDGAIYCRSWVREGSSAEAPEGAPVGDPSESSPDSNGVPPSRALLSSRPLTSSEGSAEGGADPLDVCLDHWRSEWARTRSGTKATVREKDRTAVAWMVSIESPENVRARMTAMLADQEPFVVKNASLKLLESKWDAYAVAASKNGKHAPRETPDQAEVRERWTTQEFRAAGRDRKRGVREYPGHEVAKRELDAKAAS